MNIKNMKLRNIGLNAFMSLPIVAVVYFVLLVISEKYNLELSQLNMMVVGFSVYGNEVLKSSRMDYLMFKIEELEGKIK